MTESISLQPTKSFRSHMSFGRKVEGREIVQYLGPLYSGKKAKVRVFGGGLGDQLEREFDAGLELLYSKAKEKGGNGVINISMRVSDNARYYLMWGDVVILDTEQE